MATRLKLRFRDQRSALLLKAFVFLVVLWFAAAGDGRVVPIILFLGAAFWIYLAPLENGARYRFAYLTLLAVSVIAVARGAFYAWFILSASVVAYGVFGLKARYFIYRTRIHYLVTLAVTYGVLFLFFASDRSAWFMPKLALAAAAVFSIWREFFSAERERAGGASHQTYGERSPRYETILGAFFTLAVSEVVWAASLLPLRGANAANLSFLAAVVIGDILEKSIEGTLSRRAMLTGATVAVFGTILILGTSSW